MKPLNLKPIYRYVVASILIIAGIAYGLADRYLIEHVEVAVAAPTQSVVVQAATSTNLIANSSNASSGTDATVINTAEIEPTAAVDKASSFSSDDWNYQSETTSIAVKQVTTGSGSNTVTYYAADVVVSDAASLRSAFAKNKFGTNIIEYTSKIASDNNAIFAINGDYYGFRSDGIVIRNGIIYRDQPARTGLAFYTDGTMKIYDETQTSAQKLLDAGVWNTLSFGPALVTNSAAITNFSNVAIDKNVGNRSIQSNNPRTGIGIIDANHFVFVVVDGRSSGYSRGVSLTEFAQIFENLGCTDAYNIDGGGSSTMYFMGRVVNNPLGKNQERGTSDILYIGS